VGLSPYVVLGSAVVGLLVGLTGAGGGALMTPMLILLFNVKPEAAISSDLVAAVVMRPVGSLVHVGKGTVNFRLVGWMCAGSVPMAFLGAWLLHELGSGAGTQLNVERALGAALLAGTAAMVLRSCLDSRSGRLRTATVKELSIRPALTVLIGAVGGLVVGMTSVGSGSLMIVLLLFAYPLISARQLVGTDLTQAVPLTAAAALGALAFGHVELGVTTAVVLGSVPAVLIGSLLSSRAPDRYIRPVITFVIFASGLKYAGLGTTELGWTLGAVALAAAGWWLVRTRSRSLRRAEPPSLGFMSVTSPDAADLPDPRDASPQYALPLVIRVERATPPTRTDALECAARAVLVLLADPRAADEEGEWAPAIRAWTDGRIRKVVRRARGAAWERAAELPGITVTHRTAEVRVYPPVPVDDWPPELARLQVSGTDFSDPESPLPPPSSSPVLWITPEVPMTAGKAMAQVGHAAQLAWLRLTARERSEWAEAGFDLAVRTASPARWRELLASGLPVVRDGGFTEVAPGSQTVIADLPALRVAR
jgi:uncharacterized membrane protein YfcA/peptidyl-tRNA hydrolase